MSTQITGNSITSVLKKFAKKLSGKEIEGNSTAEVLKDFANKYDGGGGGGSMLVTITESEGEYSADKTFEEIRAAIDSGQIPVCKYVDTYAMLATNSTNKVDFIGINSFEEGSGILGAMRVEIGRNNVRVFFPMLEGNPM